GLESHRNGLDQYLSGKFGLGAFNFVIERVQGGGVTATGALDIHGKSLSSLMLTIPLPGNEPEGE
ncbi:MAG: hypothetical protein OXI75_11875, partial [Rhodospirillales bacterium]|nr:hypothetical protein [Rhodospirillales bacterium]